ncbi:Fc.00g038000.m01.CDS01 [Cosmosporella sp. VM-42]
MDLRRVSSRKFKGQKLEGYTKRKITYENLNPEDVGNLEKKGQIDCWVMALPKGQVWFHGIHHSINVPLNKTMTSRDIRQIYQVRYAGEKLVKVIGEPRCTNRPKPQLITLPNQEFYPLARNIIEKHGVEIGGFAVHSSGKRVVVCATIDNLNKGAATHAES